MSRKNKKRGSVGTIKSNKVPQSENESSQFAEEEDDYDVQNSEDKDDFGCVPANNMDNDTVHIRIQDEEPKYM
jgi:hypothetical protein